MPAIAQILADVLGNMATIECCDIGRIDRMKKVACGEDPRFAGSQGGVDDRAAVAGVHLQSAQPGKFVVGDPISGEHHGVAGNLSTLT